ncbi:glycosyltransferase family 4 protein [Desulfospira joergensenii]|uniref:glycosyltransferase family 4 protein n=1 Tax=Desulfospira joergensenii TaxID=53329 RepID=UPI000688BF87|nr:glycosyltransferase family 4 protein [Desulfospira joergensenii]
MCKLEGEATESLNLAVIVKHFNLLGGAEKYAVETTRRLISRGHRVDLYSWEADEGLLAGINHIKIPCRLNISSSTRLWAFGRDVSKQLAKKKYDAVLSHDRTGCQDISVVHTFSYKTGMDRYPGFRKIDQIWMSPRAWVYLWMEKQQMNRPVLVPVSRIIEKDIIRHYPKAKNISVITPGIDTNGFSPGAIQDRRKKIRAREGIPEKDLAVLFVGSEFRRKGLDLLIPAIDQGMQLLVAGRGENMSFYRKRVSQCGNQSRVSFLGLQKNMPDWFAAADVVVLPSKAEAFGMAVLEGMACSLPVIAGQALGASCLIRHNENGFICKNRDDIARLLVRLKDPSLRKRIGENARRTALENSWDICTDHFEALCFNLKRP